MPMSNRSAASTTLRPWAVRPSPRGAYFRCFLEGYFEGIAYRVSDSLSLREFLGLSLEEPTPDHSTLSKTRRLLSLGRHQAVFRWVLQQLVREGLLSGKNLGSTRPRWRPTRR